MYLRARECVHVRANALNLCLGTAAASKYNLFRHLRLAPSIINQPTTSFHPPGRLAREIVEGGGGDPGGGKLSLESMEAEGKRFQQVLLDEEEELRRRIEFLHEVLDAEHQRDFLIHMDEQEPDEIWLSPCAVHGPLRRRGIAWMKPAPRVTITASCGCS